MTMSGSTIPPPRPAGARRENHRVRLSGEPTLYHGGGEVSSEKLAINLHLTKNPFCVKMLESYDNCPTARLLGTYSGRILDLP